MRPVLFLTRSLHSGGAERQLVLLARALRQRGLKVGVAVFYGEGEFAHELRDAGIPVHELRKGGRWSNLKFLWRLWVLLLRERPGVLHSYLSGPNLIALLLRPLLVRRGTAVVCGVRASALDLSKYDFATRASEQLHRRLLRFADAVICNSLAGLAYVNPGAAALTRFHGIDNGIDTERYRFDPEGRARCRQSWGLAADTIAIGLVGRHDPVKDHLLFLRAVAPLVAANPRLCGVLVGGEVPGVSEAIRAEAARWQLADRIVWAGHRTDLAAAYSALDVLCLSSESEGFPNVVGEAMSCGLPCVCTDVGDVRRLVGDCGWIADARTPEALSRALSQAVSALPAWDPQRSRRRIEQNFSVGALADRTLDVLAPFLTEPAA